MELDEAIRLCEVNSEPEIRIHGKKKLTTAIFSPLNFFFTVFPSVPPSPGLPCQGEDKSIYRRGARRWRKLYRVNGHLFQAKRFNHV